MFIESLKYIEIEHFAKKFNCGVSSYKKVKEDKWYIQFFTEAMGPQPEFYLSDFYCKSVSDYSQPQEVFVEKQWRKFMLDIFGEDYKKAYDKEIQKTLSEMQI